MRKAKKSVGGRSSYWSRTAEFARKNDLPYGKWTCADGREVMFNRYYEAIYQRKVDGTVERANPSEWVSDIVQDEWFYNDCTTQKRKQGLLALAAWGLQHVRLDYEEP